MKDQNTTAEELEQKDEQEAEAQEKSIQDDEVVKKLAAEIKRLQEENAVHLDNLIREKAEIENLRKRHMRELEDTAKYTIGEFSKEMVEVMESLYKAMEYKKEFDTTDSKIAGMFEGIDMTLKLLEKIFTKHGIQRVYPVDADFDHRLHQAISKLSVQDKKNNQIIDVIQAGYTIQDRLLKPALVVVNVIEE
jgi:molecular chaperone GrpE